MKEKGLALTLTWSNDAWYTFLACHNFCVNDTNNCFLLPLWNRNKVGKSPFWESPNQIKLWVSHLMIMTDYVGRVRIQLLRSCFKSNKSLAKHWLLVFQSSSCKTDFKKPRHFTDLFYTVGQKYVKILLNLNRVLNTKFLPPAFRGCWM